MTKPLHLFLLFTFSLLQCAAPLVHAHVDGKQANFSASVFSLSHALSGEQRQAECYVEESESPAISLADQFQRNDTIIFSSASFSRIVLAPAVVWVNPALPVPIRALFFSPYQKPHTQAPPVFS